MGRARACSGGMLSAGGGSAGGWATCASSTGIASVRSGVGGASDRAPAASAQVPLPRWVLRNSQAPFQIAAKTSRADFQSSNG